MSKKTAPPETAPAAKPAKVKSRFNKISARRSDLHFVDEKDCVIDPGFNTRFDFSHVPAMADSFAEGGSESIPPLKGRFSSADDKLHLTNGESRLRAVRLVKERGGPNILLPVLLEPRENYSVNGLPDDKRTVEILTSNAGKPLNILEQGLAMVRLADEHEYSQERIARTVGCSVTHVGQAIRLAKDADESVRQAIRANILSPTLAIDLLVAEPDANHQRAVLEAAMANAGEGNRITSKHIPIHVGKERQQQQRQQAAGVVVTESETDAAAAFAGEGTSAVAAAGTATLEEIRQAVAARGEPPMATHPPEPDPTEPATDPKPAPPSWQRPMDGDPVPPEVQYAVVTVDLPRSTRVRAEYQTGVHRGLFYYAFTIEGEPHKKTRPFTIDQGHCDSKKAAELAALQDMLAFAVKQKTARGGPKWDVAAGELRALIKTTDQPEKKTPPSASGSPATPPPKSTPSAAPASTLGNNLGSLQLVLAGIERADAHLQRYDAAAACVTFLEGGCTAMELSRYLLEIDAVLGGKAKK